MQKKYEQEKYIESLEGRVIAVGVGTRLHASETSKDLLISSGRHPDLSGNCKKLQGFRGVWEIQVLQSDVKNRCS